MQLSSRPHPLLFTVLCATTKFRLARLLKGGLGTMSDLNGTDFT